MVVATARLRAIHVIAMSLMVLIFLVSTLMVMLANYTPFAAVLFSFMNVLGATFPPTPTLIDASSPLILGATALGTVANIIFTITFTTIFYEILSSVDVRYILAKRLLRRVRKHVIITPINGMGLALAKKMQENKVPVIFIDESMPLVRKTLREGMIAIHGDAANADTLVEARIKDALGLYALYDVDARNTFITIEAKRIEKNIRVITRIKRLEDLIKMERSGANRVMLPEAAVGIEMGEFLVANT